QSTPLGRLLCGIEKYAPRRPAHETAPSHLRGCVTDRESHTLRRSYKRVTLVDVEVEARDEAVDTDEYERNARDKDATVHEYRLGFAAPGNDPHDNAHETDQSVEHCWYP